MKRSILCLMVVCSAAIALVPPATAQRHTVPEFPGPFTADCMSITNAAPALSGGWVASTPAADPASSQDGVNEPGARTISSPARRTLGCAPKLQAINWQPVGLVDHVIWGGTVGTAVGLVVGYLHARDNDTLAAPAILLADMLIGSVVGGAAGGVLYAGRVLRR
jgi:hypothetical protein